MIYKSKEFGNIKTILIELGEGDVQVGACRNSEIVGVQFMNDTPTKIGAKHNTTGTTTDDSKPEAVITFTSVESVEVLEHALKQAKVFLRNKYLLKQQP